ncbi:MAG: ADP-ribosylglycohydrolase family protein [Clostridiales bacterium]|nr:ADP-ribosylglycohydrolase family protein [Clostridiales bacterium]
MLGAIIGDIVGSVYEWNNIKTKDFPLFSEKCFFTDDTVMTIAVADALLNGGSADDFIDSMKKYGKLFPKAGYGGGFRKWLSTGSREPYNSWGNGSAMRVSPCAWFAESLEEAETLAERSAAVTHNHPEGIKGARATAAAIYLARIDTAKDMIKAYVETNYGYDLSRTLDEIRPNYSFNETCQETVPEAIIAFLESNSFEDAIRNAISLGGDSDTLAAITGSIAEAAYGIPTADFEGMGYTQNGIMETVFQLMDDNLSVVINAWLDSGKPMTGMVIKDDWKTNEFSKPSVIKVNFRITESQYAKIRFGLLPMQMEDKWFAYYDDGRIHLHRSWTGAKIYEAAIQKSENCYIITELIVERDAALYANTDDNEDVRSFHFLLGRGLLGYQVDAPVDTGNTDDVLRGWGSYGKMIL